MTTQKRKLLSVAMTVLASMILIANAAAVTLRKPVANAVITQNDPTHDTRDSALIDARCEQTGFPYQEHIRHGSGDEISRAAENNAFGELRIVGKLGACKHLLEAVAMLQPREARVLAQAHG